MNLPPEGLCVPCTLVAVRDGDTVEVQLRTHQVCAVRLLDCWCEELRTEAGRRAKAYIETLFETRPGPLHLWIPLAPDRDRDGILDLTELLHAISFDRVVGRLFLAGEDLSELMVAAGHATRTKRA